MSGAWWVAGVVAFGIAWQMLSGGDGTTEAPPAEPVTIQVRYAG